MNDSNPAPESNHSDAQLDLVIAAWLQQRERGDAPDPQALLKQHPHLAAALQSFFAADARLQQLAPADHQMSPTIVPAGEHRAGEEILGKYRLLELIGEGGMGAVWLAQQRHPVRRQVAIKLIRAGMDSRQVLARFDAERQALALMDHPHIARVLDGGVTDRGRPFFVMEYIKGLPLTEYCDKAQLSLRERLQLFIPVCQAVQHAHLKGIVHRDLKPSNILVCLYDGRAVPRVIDFGLARALHHDLTNLTLHTAHGQMVGTPVYMSPEQAEFNNLDIDTRSDVYSLGVVLYELLTGHTPLDRQRLQKAAWDEMLRLIREEDPLPPSTRVSGSERLPGLAAQRRMDPRLLQRSLTGELDWIVMRALEKERSRRYETSSGLARDIERYLADEAVEACPPSQLYRWRKFFRRHRPQVLASATLMLGLLAAMAGLAWGWQQSRLAEARVSQTLRELLAERSAKEQAVAEGQRERDLSRTKRADAILASITGIIGNSASASAPPSGAQKSLRQSFQAWSDIQEDAERVAVLEAGLADSAKALTLASQYPAVLQATVGISPHRRQLALQLLQDKQRSRDCAPEIRAVSCLFTLALGSTDVPALSEAAQVLGPGTALRDMFERNLWRRLPDFSDVDREAPFRLLLSSRVKYENALDRQVDVPEEVRRLFLLRRIPSAADWYACLEPPVTESSPPELASWYWKRLIQDLKSGSAVVPADAAGGELALRGSHFLYRLVPALPEAALADAASDMLDILEASIAGNSGPSAGWDVPGDWMRALLKRLSPGDLPAVALRLDDLLKRHSDQRSFQTLSPILEPLLPHLHPQQRSALAGRLMTLITRAETWDDHARQSLRWWIGTASQDFSAAETEQSLQPFLGILEPEAGATAAEVLANVLFRHAPQMSAEEAALWTERLWKAQLSAAPEALAAVDARLSPVPATLGVLTPRLSAADRSALPQRFAALTAATGRPLVQDPFFLQTVFCTASSLPPELLRQVRTELLAAAAAPIPSGEASHSAMESAELRSDVLRAVVRHADPADDDALLGELEAVLETSADSGHAAATVAAAFSELVSRGDTQRVQRVWKTTLAMLNRQKWGIEYNKAEGFTKMFEVARGEVETWQHQTAFFSKQLAPLLDFLAGKLATADTAAAWNDLLGLLQISAPAGMFSEWDYTRAEICSSALTTLAARLPAAECPQRLQELMIATHAEIGDNAPLPVAGISRGFILFHSIVHALLPRCPSQSAYEAANSLTHNASKHHAVMLSLAWQSVIPQLDVQHLAEFEEHLFQSAIVTDEHNMGPQPWLRLSLRLGLDPVRKRWQDVLRMLQATDDRKTTERLCEFLIACVDHVTPAEHQSAVQPLLARLEPSLRLPNASEKQIAQFGIETFRFIVQLRPEASIQDAIVRIARALDPDQRRKLADQCLQVALNCDADEDWWLPFRVENFPGAVCGDAAQLLNSLGHVNCKGWIGESLLRRFEELTLHGGAPVLKDAEAGSQVFVMGPELLSAGGRFKASKPPEPWPEVLPRRFRSVAAAARWVESNQPAWTQGRVQQ
ncbi:MAG: protein kinase domain-containing protein [Planctomycetota bacterium]